MSNTSKISLSVKKQNEDLLEIADAYADRNRMSRSDFLFKLVRQYHYINTKSRENV